jgi:hypothetical protein
MIQEIVHMTSEFEAIFGDGGLRGEKLLQILEIKGASRIVLDYHHLLTDDTGIVAPPSDVNI